MGGGGCQGSAVPVPGHLFLSPQPGGLRREAGVLTENLTPALACTPPGILSLSLPASLAPHPHGLSPASHLQTTLPRPNPHSSLHHSCEGIGIRKEGTPDKISTGGSGTPPICLLPGKPEAGVPLSWFPAPGPSQGAAGPQNLRLSGVMVDIWNLHPSSLHPTFSRGWVVGGGEAASHQEFGRAAGPWRTPRLLPGTPQREQTRPVARSPGVGLGVVAGRPEGAGSAAGTGEEG